MSGLLIPCPKCGSGLRLRNRSQLGKIGKCPKCDHRFVLQEPEEVELELDTDTPAVGTSAHWVPDPEPAGPPPGFPIITDEPAFPSFETASSPSAVATEPTPEEAPEAPQVSVGMSLAEVVQRIGKPAKRKVVSGAAVPVPVGQGTRPQPVAKREYMLFQPPVGTYKLIFADGKLVEIHSQPDSKAVAALPRKAAVAIPPRSPLSQRKRKQRNLSIALGAVVALGIVGVVAFAVNQQGPPVEAKPEKAKPQIDQVYVAQKAGLKENFEAANAFKEKTLPASGGPIPMTLVPPGSSIVVNLHPAAIWQDTTQWQELRATLGPLGQWAETKIKSITSFEPKEIEELRLCIALPGRGVPPEVSAVATLTQPLKKSEFLERFLASPSVEMPSVYVSDGKAYLLQDDGRTFAVGPETWAQDMLSHAQFDQAARPGIDELRLHSDRARHFTVLFLPEDLQVHQESLVSEPVQPLLGELLEWLGPEIEAVAWSAHLTDQKFFSEFQFRTAHAWTPEVLEKEMAKKIDRLPAELYGAVGKMQPKQLGFRKIIGRFPAMMKVYSLRTLGGVGDRFAQFTTFLDERAAPNLALGAMLAWDESTRTDFGKAAPSPAPSGPKLPDTIAGRLKLKMEVDFNRRPLQEAFADIAEATKLTIDINGDALKFAGYTKNMPQTFQLGEVPAEQAIGKILSQYEQMCVVIRDEAAKKLEVMTFDLATKENLTPLKFPMPKP